MEELKARIQAEGRYLGDGILKIDSILNHQIDPGLMVRMAEFLPLGDHVLVLDDFLASGKTIDKLVHIVKSAGCHLAGSRRWSKRRSRPGGTG